MLVALLALGHGCELPAFTDLLSHASEDAHHPVDDHADKNLISCDSVGVPPNTAHLQVVPGFDVAEGRPVAVTVPVRRIMSSLPDSNRPPSQPSLFLLYASLLI